MQEMFTMRSALCMMCYESEGDVYVRSALCLMCCGSEGDWGGTIAVPMKVFQKQQWFTSKELFCE